MLQLTPQHCTSPTAPYQAVFKELFTFMV